MTSSFHSVDYESRDPVVQAESFLNALFGDRSGVLAAAYGIDGHFNSHHTYTFDGKWKPVFFEWPKDREAFIKYAIRSLRPNVDVYLIPLLRLAKNAKAGYGADGEFCWVDIDHSTDRTWRRLERLVSQGSLLVHSGGRGGLHVYIHLDGLYPSHIIEKLNKQLTSFLKADSKFKDNSHLRLPGTWNHKGRAAGKKSYPVTLEDITDSDISPWSPADLSNVLGPLRKSQQANTKANTKPKAKATGSRSRQRPDLKIIDPDPIPTGLPDEMVGLVHFREKKRGAGDQSRSGQLYALIAAMMSYGYNDSQTMGLALLSEPGQEKWLDELDLRYEIQRCINKLRPNHCHVGKTCIEAGCPSRDDSRITAEVARIKSCFRSHYRAGRTSSSDTKIMDALLRRVEKIGSLELDMSERELSLLAGVCRNTARSGLQRLITEGYVEQIRSSNGKPVRHGTGPIETRAYRYRIKSVEVQVEPHYHKGEKKGEEYGSTLILDESSDVWRYRGLASSRRTYEILLDGNSTISEVAEMQGLQRQTIRRHLKKLEDHGLALRNQDGKSWVALQRKPEELAEELGTFGSGAKQADHHTWERKSFSLNRSMQREEDERDWQTYIEERLCEGWRRVGRYNHILVPPWAVS